MTDAPSLDRAVLDALRALRPARVQRRLERDPTWGDAWLGAFEGPVWTVAAGSETVRLAPDHGRVRAVDQVTCTCLLSPRCAHVAAVVERLVVRAAQAPDPLPASPQAPAPTLDEAQRALAHDVLTTAARLHRQGWTGLDTAQRAMWRALIGRVRALRLHRLERAMSRVGRLVTLAVDGDAAFARADLADAVLAAVETATHLAHAPSPDPAVWVGQARRPYTVRDGTVLVGVFSEPIVTRSGFAGVVTWLTDGDRWYTVHDVRPGDPSRALAAYEQPIALGEATIRPRQLARAGLILGTMRLSPDGRLGRGAATRAVQGPGCAWDAEPLAAAFATPLDIQRRRVAEALTQPLDTRPPGWDLVFVPAIVEGLAREHLVLRTPDDRVCVTAAHQDATLPWVDNLGVLAMHPGRPLHAVLRLSTRTPRAATLLAFSWADEPDAPVDLGLTRLTLPALADRRIAGAQAPDLHGPLSELTALRWRWRADVAHGQSTSLARRRGDRADMARLQALGMPHAAELLREVVDPARTPEDHLHAWLATGVYLRAADATHAIEWI